MPIATPSGGLEELVDETSGKEIVATPAIVDRFADLKKKYEQYLIIQEDLGQWVRNYLKEIVLPCDINLFLQTTQDYEHYPNYQKYTGIFISQLIQNSYDAGNSDFELDMNLLKPINYLASRLSGTEERMVRVVIKGEIGSWCGIRTRYSIFTIEKASDYCGYEAQHSIFTIEKAGKSCGKDTIYSIFKSTDKELIKDILKNIARFKNNKVYHIQPDGTLKRRWF